jgi:hypothetical protein
LEARFVGCSLRKKRAGFGFRQVGGITVDIEDHGTGVKANRGIRMRGGIVEELVGSLVGQLGCLGLVGSKRAKGNKHGGVNSTGIVEENTNDLLDAGDASFVQARRRVDGRCELGGGAVLWLGPGMGRVLGTGWSRMGEVLEGFGDITRHGEINGAGSVVPLEVEAEVDVTVPVSGDLKLAITEATVRRSLMGSRAASASVRQRSM